MANAWEFISAVAVLVVFFGILGWLSWLVIRKAADPGWIIIKLIISLVYGVGGFFLVVKLFHSSPGYLPIFILPIAVPLGLWWAPQLGAALASPLTSAFDGGGQEVEAKPLYSIAKTQLAKGDYARAKEEIRKQLDKFPNDYEGMMLLAELQAHQLNDFPAAEITIQKILANTRESPAHVADALHRLADWQLEFLADPAAAGETLRRIAERFPNSVTAQIALERAAHLPTTEQLLNAKDPKALVLKTGKRNIGISSPKPEPASQERGFSDEAVKLVEHLQQFPADSEAREQLAEIYSSGYKRLDFAVQQLRLLVDYPGHTQKQITRWLNRIADFQMAHGQPDEAKKSLKELISKFPGTVTAEQAENRLILLDRESKAKEAPHLLKLGTYKKNLGISKEL